MKIDGIVLREIHLSLLRPFETSTARKQDRRVLLVEVKSGSRTGWGECTAGEGPFYSEETVDTAWLVLTRFMLPELAGCNLQQPGRLVDRLRRIRGHRMAKACVEAALWDLHAQQLGQPLWRVLGGTRQQIPCGVSLGIEKNSEALVERITAELQSGYRRIKIKIKHGWDLEIVERVRESFPEIDLMVDANGAYTLDDADMLREMDRFNLLMIEQPLGYDDLYGHAKLQAQIRTPICLDESIRHSGDAAVALQLNACRIINIKVGRVGGLTEAKRLHDLCQDKGIPVWCGGMLESGIGRAHNLALCTLENFTLAGDVSASRRYYDRDTVSPPIEVSGDGYISVPQNPGLGYSPDRDWIDQLTTRTESFS